MNVTTLLLLLIFILGYGALGALFGYKWPGARWTWGLWLTAVAMPIVIVAKLVLDESEWLYGIPPFMVLLVNIPGTVLSCIGSGLAARYTLRRSQQL